MATRRQQIEEYLKNQNMQDFLDLLSFTEGTQKHGYYATFGNGKIEDLSQHPNKIWGKTGDGATSATGRYQFLSGTWKEQAKKLGLSDFGEHSQDLAAVSLITDRGAVQDILNGNLNSAMKKLSSTWASLPYNKSPNQHQKSFKDVMNYWDNLKKRHSSPNPTETRPSSFNQGDMEQLDEPLQPQSNLENGITNPVQTDIQDATSLPAFEQGYINQASMEADDNIQRQRYREKLAEAFGTIPSAREGMPEEITNIIRSIYESV